MARETKTYVIRPETQAFPGTEPWAASGEGIVNAFVGQEETTKKPTFGEGGMLEANRVSQTAKNKRKVTGKWKSPGALAEGEIPVKAQAHAYCQSLSSKDLEFKFSNGMLFESSATTTEPLWVASASVSVVGKTLAEVIPEFEIENTKAAGGHVYAIYIVLTTETERSAATTAGQISGTGTATAEGTVEIAGNNNWVAGNTVVFKLATVSPGTVEITDTEGNTYVKDGSATNGTTVVQQWHVQLVKALSGTGKMKLKGLGASAKYATISEHVFKVLEADVTGTATGTGTVTEVATGSALRASQGDFVSSSFATNVKSTFTKDTAEAYVVDAIAESEGLTLGGEWNGTPTEGATNTQKPKFNTSGEWAALTIAYKVLATTAVEGNPLVMMI